MACQHHVRVTAGPLCGRFEQVLHVRAARVEDIGRIDRVVQRDQQRQALGQGLELVGQPGQLGFADVAALGHVGVEADDVHQRCAQRPEHIGLGHRRAAVVAHQLREDLRLAVAEELHEAVQGVARRHVLAVMVAGHRDDGREVVLVGFVELRPVLVDGAVEVDAVAEDVEEGRVVRGLGARNEVRLHAFGDAELRVGVGDATDVAVDVEGDLLGGRDRLDVGRRDDAGEVHLERRLVAAKRRRQGPEMGVSDLLRRPDVAVELAVGRGARDTVPMGRGLGFRHALLLGLRVSRLPNQGRMTGPPQQSI
mmetsp:Transcript_9644/g.22544  ORF Transcript_9644/g.22544 Transcript_9644/m.22544 type:complete len:309 (+) Transcript_9644:412-1338(+)